MHPLKTKNNRSASWEITISQLTSRFLRVFFRCGPFFDLKQFFCQQSHCFIHWLLILIGLKRKLQWLKFMMWKSEKTNPIPWLLPKHWNKGRLKTVSLHIEIGCQPKNRGVYPWKWMVKIMVPNPMNKWMIWGFPHIFGNTQMNRSFHSDRSKWMHPRLIDASGNFVETLCPVTGSSTTIDHLPTVNQGLIRQASTTQPITLEKKKSGFFLRNDGIRIHFFWAKFLDWPKVVGKTNKIFPKGWLHGGLIYGRI